MKISALNRKLRKAFGGRVTAVLADGCIVLRGELDCWDDVVRAGQLAATKYATRHVVNDITFTGGEDAPMRVPALRDDALEGQTQPESGFEMAKRVLGLKFGSRRSSSLPEMSSVSAMPS